MDYIHERFFHSNAATQGLRSVSPGFVVIRSSKGRLNVTDVSVLKKPLDCHNVNSLRGKKKREKKKKKESIESRFESMFVSNNSGSLKMSKFELFSIQCGNYF